MATIRGIQCIKALGLLFALVATSTQAATSRTTHEWNEEPSLTRLLGKLGIDPRTASLAEGRDATWVVNGKATVTLAFEFSANAGKNSFGIYDTSDPTRRIELFSGRDRANASARVWFVPEDDGYEVRLRGGPTSEHELFSGKHFGFYLSNAKRGGQTYFSDTRLNGDGRDHLQAYLYEGAGASRADKKHSHRSGTGYVLAWEDSFRNAHSDYQDMIVTVRSVAPVPLPAALGMALAGLAVFGLAAGRRRRET